MSEQDERKGFHLPEWVRDIGLKILPWALIGLIGGSIGLFIDNIHMKKDLSRETWRNDQQDMRLDKTEIKQDRIEGSFLDLKDSFSSLKDDQNDFQSQALHRLDILLEKDRPHR